MASSTAESSSRHQLDSILDPFIDGKSGQSEDATRGENGHGKGRLTVLCNHSVVKILTAAEDAHVDGISSTTKLCSRIAVGVEAVNHLTGEKIRIFTNGDQDSSSSKDSSLLPAHRDGAGHVVLAAGALQTPRLLVASGIFAETTSTLSNASASSPSAAIRVPLQDHPVMPMIFLNTRGVMSAESTLPPNAIHGWICVDQDGNLLQPDSDEPPKVQLLMMDGRVTPGIAHELLLPRYSTRGASSFVVFYMLILRPLLAVLVTLLMKLTIIQWIVATYTVTVLVCVVRPTSSTGNLTIDRNDPFGPLQLDLGFLANKNDEELMSAGASAARKYFGQARGGNFLEALPGSLISSVPWLYHIYKQLFTVTYFHVCGTCGMVTESATTSPVPLSSLPTIDESLSVSSISHLKVADASVVPDNGIPSSPIQATVMAIGVRAADNIIAHQQ